ncbi:hypothetical protein Bca4012_016057 [Brassica carinata]
MMIVYRVRRDSRGSYSDILQANRQRTWSRLSYDCFCSGTTAVTVLKQGDCLVISNLGDYSLAVLGTRGSKNNLKAVQLTVDLKPCVQSQYLLLLLQHAFFRFRL